MHLPQIEGEAGSAPSPEHGLRLANTLAKKVEPFRPRVNGTVRLFTCGPSVYRKQHLGNFRTYLYEDVLHRYLEYQGYRVERLINYTDVEDKAIEECRRRGLSLEELTVPIEKRFQEDCRLLNIRLPGFIPRSSTSVETAAHIAGRLVEKGYAYRYGGDVYYDPLTHKGFGQIFGLDMSTWPKKKRHFGKDTYPGRRWNKGDFILWHGYREGETVFWDSELGRGRPSWNIQDPAMIIKHLGPEIDIACGGVDNLYRHHDYTRAVVEAYADTKMANYWLHGEHVLVEGTKMSKSKGNVVYVDGLVGRGFTPRQIRFYLLDGHYRRKLNLHDSGLVRSKERFEHLMELTAACRREPDTGAVEPDEELSRGFERHMDSDLDVGGAIEEMIAILARRNLDEGRRDLRPLRRALDRIDGVLALGL
jgi:cysteinyl-tRNA synthetase